MNEIVAKIPKILVFFKPEYLNTSISLFSNNFIKNNWVAIRNINGNISNIIEGEFKNAKKIGKLMSTFISLKKSSSESTLRIKAKLVITRNTKHNDLKYIKEKNFI